MKNNLKMQDKKRDIPFLLKIKKVLTSPPLWLEILLLLFCILIFLLIRLSNLKSIPIYLDEAIYINWAHLFKLDKNLAYVSMQDGKTPFYFWIVSFFLRIKQNPLIAARMVSVIAGAGTMITSWFMTRIVFGKKTALVFLPLYILVPYAQFLERMAFADSLQVFLGTLSITLVFAIVKPKHGRAHLFGFLGAFFVGIILGMAYLTKSSAKIYLFLTFFLLIYQAVISIKKPKKIIYLLLVGSAIWIPYAEIITAFRTGASRFFLNISTKEKLLTFSPKEILQNLFGHIYINNFPVVLNYLLTYLKVPIILIVIFSIFRDKISKKKLRALPLALITLAIFSAIFFSSKIPASRYFFPIVPFVVILGSYGFLGICSSFKKKYFPLIILILILTVILPFMKLDLDIILNPKKAGFAVEDRHYLFESDLSGIGIEETIKIIEDHLKTRDVVLVVDSFWGQPDYIEVAIKSKPQNHRFLLKKQIDSSIPQEIRKLAKNMDVFFLFLDEKNRPEPIFQGKETTLVKSFPRLPLKTGETRHAYLYRFNN